ncbi:MAG: hypothetical protein ACK46Q_12750 [Hyphomonas sp.]
MALETEIAYFNQNADAFKRDHRLEWVVISGRTVLGFFRRFELAAMHAMNELGDTPFLIRQIDGPPAIFPQLIVGD